MIFFDSKTHFFCKSQWENIICLKSNIFASSHKAQQKKKQQLVRGSLLFQYSWN